MKSTIERIKKYKELLADITDINIKLSELEENILGVSGQSTEERTGKTYKITSSVESQVEKIMEGREQLKKEKASIEREIDRIDNAMSILTDEERDIILIIFIENKKYWRIQEKLNKSYPRIKQIECEALKKMSKYID